MKVVVCKLDDSYYAIDIRNVVSIEKMKKIRTIPLSPIHLAGIIELREQIIHVIDLRTLLGINVTEGQEDIKIIIVENEEIKVGLIVDSATDVLDLEIKKIQELNEQDNDAIEYVYKFEDKLILLLKMEEIIKFMEKEVS